MTFTYIDPGANNRDAVRFLIQDTDSTTPHMTDEEIAYLLTTWDNNPYDAAIAAAEIISGQYAHRTNYSRSVGDLSISESYSSSAIEFRALADRLRAQRDRQYAPIPRFAAQALVATNDKLVETYKSDFYTGIDDNQIQ
jgi:hypothetical protein